MAKHLDSPKNYLSDWNLLILESLIILLIYYHSIHYLPSFIRNDQFEDFLMDRYVFNLANNIFTVLIHEFYKNVDYPYDMNMIEALLFHQCQTFIRLVCTYLFPIMSETLTYSQVCRFDGHVYLLFIQYCISMTDGMQ